MAVLDTEARSKLKPKSFAAPASNSHVTDKQDHFPVEDPAHAGNARARVGAMKTAPSWWSGSLESLKKTVYSKGKKKLKEPGTLRQAIDHYMAQQAGTGK